MNQPNRRQLVARRRRAESAQAARSQTAVTPFWPVSAAPDDHWSDHELAAFIAHHDATIGQPLHQAVKPDDRWTDDELAVFIAQQDALVAQRARASAKAPARQHALDQRGTRIRRTK